MFCLLLNELQRGGGHWKETLLKTLWTFPSLRGGGEKISSLNHSRLSHDWEESPTEQHDIKGLFFFFPTVKVTCVSQLKKKKKSCQLNQTTSTINSFHWQPCGPSFPVVTHIHCLHCQQTSKGSAIENQFFLNVTIAIRTVSYLSIHSSWGSWKSLFLCRAWSARVILSAMHFSCKVNIEELSFPLFLCGVCT